MPDVNVTADLRVQDGTGGTRQLNTDDLKTAATGAAKESTLTSILAAVDQLEGFTDGLEALLTSVGLNTDTVEQLLADLKGFTDGLEGLLTTLNAKDFATQATLAALKTRVDLLGTEAKQDAAKAVFDSLLLAVDQVETNQTTQTTRLTEIRDSEESDFARLLKFQPRPGEEIRRDETTTDDYHGAAIDGTATNAVTWKIARFSKDASGNITRVRYRTNIAWDDRANAANWP